MHDPAGDWLVVQSAERVTHRASFPQGLSSLYTRPGRSSAVACCYMFPMPSTTSRCSMMRPAPGSLERNGAHECVGTFVFVRWGARVRWHVFLFLSPRFVSFWSHSVFALASWACRSWRECCSLSSIAGSTYRGNPHPTPPDKTTYPRQTTRTGATGE